MGAFVGFQENWWLDTAPKPKNVKKAAPLAALSDGGKGKQLRIENVLNVAGPATVAPTVVTYPATVTPTVVTPTVVTPTVVTPTVVTPTVPPDTFSIEVCPHTQRTKLVKISDGTFCFCGSPGESVDLVKEGDMIFITKGDGVKLRLDKVIAKAKFVTQSEFVASVAAMTAQGGATVAPSPAHVAPNPAQGVAPNPAQGVAPNPAQGVAPTSAQGVAPNPAQGVAPSPAQHVAPSVAPSPAQGVAPSPAQNVASNPAQHVAVLKLHIYI